MSNSDGQVVIDLSLRKDGIKSDIEWLKSNLSELGNDVDADQISEKFENAMNKTKRSVDDAVESINDKKAKPKIDADDSSLKQKTSESSEKIEELGKKRAKTKITADNSDVTEKVEDTTEELDKIPKQKKTTVTVQDNASETTTKIGNKFEETEKKSSGFTETLKGTALGMGIYQTAMAAGQVVTEHLGDAINRVDTLNNSKRVFENMGYSARDTKVAMNDLNDSINGLPTSLDEAVQGVQLVASTTGDLKQAQKVWAALNDGIIGFGGSSEQVQTAVQQLSQAFAGGKIDAETWNSMLDAQLGPTLNAIAKDMGKTTAQLKDGLSKGTISVKEFQDELIKLDTKGGGGLKSLHQIAKDSTSGIATSIKNAGTAVTRGLGDVITAFSNMLKAITGSNLSEIIQDMGKKANSALEGMAKAFSKVPEKIKPLTSALSPLKSLLPVITGAMKGFVTALAGFAAIKGIQATISGVAGAFRTLNSVMKANPILAVVSAVLSLAGAFVSLYQHNPKFKKFVDDVVKNIKTLIDNVVKVASKISKDFVGAFNNIAGPVKKAFTGIWNHISPDLKTLQKNIISTVQTIQKNWDKAWKEIQKVTEPIFKTISKFVDSHMKQIKSIIDSTLKIISTVWSSIWNNIKNLFILVWDMLFNKSKVIKDIKNLINDNLESLKKIWSAAWNIMKNLFSIVWDAIKDCAKKSMEWIKDKISDIVNDIQKNWNNMWKAIGDFFSDCWDDIKNCAKNAMDWLQDTISNTCDKISDGWNKTWQSLSDFFGDIWKDIKKYAQDGINGVIDVINAGIDGIDSVWKFFTGHETSIHHLKPVKFAQGGIVDRHLSMVNDGDGENWKELIETPDGDLMMSNERNAVLPLEPGTRIYNGDETKAIMNTLGVDHYATGGVVGGIQRFKDGGVVSDLIDWGSHELKDIGSWIKDKWDAVTKFLKHPIENTKAIINKAITAPLKKISNSNFVDLGKGIFNKLTQPISDWFKKGLEDAKKKHDEETSVGGFGSIKDMKNSDDLKKLVKAALEANGLSTSDDMIARVMRQIATESGGNAHAVQPGADPDGDGSGPAMGLMQMKRSTFNAYKAPGHDDIFNAYDNLLAALNYAKHRYGSSLSFLGNGHGYDNGGVVDEMQLAWLAENNREYVINPQRATADSLLREAATERLAYDPNSQIAKAIAGINAAQSTNGTIVPNTIVSNSSPAVSNSINADSNKNNGVGNIIVDLDGKTIAEASYQYTKVLQGQDVRLQSRMGGVSFG